MTPAECSGLDPRLNMPTVRETNARVAEQHAYCPVLLRRGPSPRMPTLRRATQPDWSTSSTAMTWSSCRPDSTTSEVERPAERPTLRVGVDQVLPSLTRSWTASGPWPTHQETTFRQDRCRTVRVGSCDPGSRGRSG